MFTGLVESMGLLEARARRGPGFRLSVRAELGALELGESVSVSGVCLSVVRSGPAWFEADVSAETVDRSTLGHLPLGGSVNLERALTLGARLGGHLVSGHVDAVVRVMSVEPLGEARRLELAAPAELMSYLAPKGSVALDGVSLTVNEVGAASFDLVLIPLTQRATTLSSVRPGSELNLEVDLLARYVVTYLDRSRGKASSSAAPSPSQGSGSGLAEALKRAGWM